MTLNITNNSEYNLKLFDARYLWLLNKYNYESLETPEMLQKLEENPKIKERLIEIKAGTKFCVMTTGLDRYYIYSPTGACTLSVEYLTIEYSYTGGLYVTNPRAEMVMIF